MARFIAGNAKSPAQTLDAARRSVSEKLDCLSGCQMLGIRGGLKTNLPNSLSERASQCRADLCELLGYSLPARS